MPSRLDEEDGRVHFHKFSMSDTRDIPHSVSWCARFFDGIWDSETEDYVLRDDLTRNEEEVTCQRCISNFERDIIKAI